MFDELEGEQERRAWAVGNSLFTTLHPDNKRLLDVHAYSACTSTNSLLGFRNMLLITMITGHWDMIANCSRLQESQSLKPNKMISYLSELEYIEHYVLLL
jgi:hypothetical protein